MIAVSNVVREGFSIPEAGELTTLCRRQIPESLQFPPGAVYLMSLTCRLGMREEPFLRLLAFSK
jgi:hypothetical protein